MYEIGKMNTMKVIRDSGFGFYLDSETGNTDDDLLIPNGSLFGNKIAIGDTIEVFVYRDSSDRPIATMKKPLITVGEIKKLRVVGRNNSGAFIEMGLERDIFVPKKEQKYHISEGNKYLFKMYVDKTGRLAATTDINGALETAEIGSFEKDQEVEGTLYGYQTNGAAMIAIDDKFKAYIPKSDFFEDLEPGNVIKAKIFKIFDDGKIALTMRSSLKNERIDLKDHIINELKENNGFIAYNDKSTPDEIRDKFKTSKNYFKIALGNLMKEGLVKQDEKGSYLINGKK